VAIRIIFVRGKIVGHGSDLRTVGVDGLQWVVKFAFRARLAARRFREIGALEPGILSHHPVPGSGQAAGIQAMRDRKKVEWSPPGSRLGCRAGLGLGFGSHAASALAGAVAGSMAGAGALTRIGMMTQKRPVGWRQMPEERRKTQDLKTQESLGGVGFARIFGFGAHKRRRYKRLIRPE